MANEAEVFKVQRFSTTYKMGFTPPVNDFMEASPR